MTTTNMAEAPVTQTRQPGLPGLEDMAGPEPAFRDPADDHETDEQLGVNPPGQVQLFE